VIAYLEQLEQDLVEAIERSEATGERDASRRLTRAAHSAARSLTPRPAWLVIAALALIIVAGAALVHSGSRNERAVQPQPSPSVPAVPPGTITVFPDLRIFGDLIRIDAGTWRGAAQGPGGTGTLTLTGAPRIPADPNNDPPPVFNRMRFRWDSPNGTLTGCSDATIYRRPHGRWVWDGTGTITTATGVLGKFRGGEASLAGRTLVSAPGKAYISLGSGGRPQADC
jgi:hypothetical protein